MILTNWGKTNGATAVRTTCHFNLFCVASIFYKMYSANDFVKRIMFALTFPLFAGGQRVECGDKQRVHVAQDRQPMDIPYPLPTRAAGRLQQQYSLENTHNAVLCSEK